MMTPEEKEHFITSIAAGNKTAVELSLGKWGRECLGARNQNGYTPLILAVQKQHTDITLLLLDAGADVNEREKEHLQTPLMLAAMYDHKALAEALLRNGADPDLKNRHGLTAQGLARRMQADGTADFLEGWKQQQAQELAREIAAISPKLARDLPVRNLLKLRKIAPKR
jgi:ankyrin repeat protein